MPLLTVHLSEHLYFTAQRYQFFLIYILKSLLIAFKMLETSDPIILSPSAADHKPKEMWRIPVRLSGSLYTRVRGAGKSYGEIKKETDLKRSIIQGIITEPSSRTTRKGKTFKPYLLKPHEVRRIFLFVSEAIFDRTSYM